MDEKVEEPTTNNVDPHHEKKFWLSAWHDPVAQLSAFNPHVSFCDVYGDGDSRLLVADIKTQSVNVFNGTSKQSQVPILGRPVALCTYFPDNRTPRIASFVCCSGPFAYMFRNLRPYFKFTVPRLPVSEVETTVWDDLKQETIAPSEAHEKLLRARNKGTRLTSCSLDLLALATNPERESFIKAHVDSKREILDCITAAEVLRRDVDQWDAVGMLVIGTESGRVLVLDPSGSKILKTVQLPSAPVHIAVGGLYSVSYRIVVACRDGALRTIKNGDLTGITIQLESPVCGLALFDRSLVVGLMDSTLQCFRLKGKKSWSLKMERPITNVAKFDVNLQSSKTGTLVCLRGGEVHMYVEKELVSAIQFGNTLTAIAFGKYGREQNTLVGIDKAGGVQVKMLKRTAKLDVSCSLPGPPPEQDIPLNIPRKTKLYVEQTQRERDQATDMHRAFQQDLCKLRLVTAQSYVKMLTDGSAPVSYSSGAGRQLSVHAQVQGLGPLFSINVELQNTGSSPATGLTASFHFNANLYHVPNPIVTIPALLPKFTHKFTVPIQCVDDAGSAQDVRMVVSGADESSAPLLTAIINMPMSEEVLG